ncbi:hypothetical protein CWI38_0226p0030 [Hamiltosporidium tvaerminnensis]|uniref:Uncharacterized protein n=1 Tax=Hamiltosporidium tvaerminnensis TaxID=1176355 RepID=A0A4V2JY44_9MICR|nr:hypothetical protein CWI38_0226p0030 [Hamiltosporidium tvaerminnensis]
MFYQKEISIITHLTDKPQLDSYLMEEKYIVINLIEAGIPSQGSLQTVKTQKFRKYDLLTNKIGLSYKFGVEIILSMYLKRLHIPMNIEAYIQSIDQSGKSWERASLCQQEEEEDGGKKENTKNIMPHILDDITTVKEPTIYINKESDLEEDNQVVEKEQEII